MAGPPVIRHVAVVGLMGSGKTTVGSRLAAALGWPLRDSDADIETREGRTVRELREELGTDAMHRIEARQLLDALADPAPSVVCGAASIADDDACLAALRDPAVLVVFLTVDPALGALRFRGGAHRPWYGDDPARFLAEQAAVRYPRLRSLEPVEIATDRLAPGEVVRAALGALAARGLAVDAADG